MREFSAQEQLGRWEDLREVKNLMGRLSADYVLKEQRAMFTRYWSGREDVCLGVNEGWFDGADAVRAYYTNQADRVALESSLIQAAFPEELGGKTAEEVYGVGMMDYKPVDTPVIELAADGQTAKGLWSIRGSHSAVTAGGPVAYWEWGWFAVDFIREADGWKIWHMQYLQDVCRPCGFPWTGEEKAYKERPEFAGIAQWQAAQPNVPCALHERYHAQRRPSRGPRMPEPYETFDETFTYGRQV
jgi:hypothetical protein